MAGSSPAMTRALQHLRYFGAACASAIFLKHFRHRQSPPSTGIGSRTVSSAHQQGPDRAQENSTPQPAQARRREVGAELSNRRVMKSDAIL
jgi:hypothetical protein